MSVALFGCPFVPSRCLGEVLGRADANIVGETELVLGVRIAPLCFEAKYVSAVLGIGYGGPDGFEISPLAPESISGVVARAACKATITKNCCMRLRPPQAVKLNLGTAAAQSQARCSSTQPTVRTEQYGAPIKIVTCIPTSTTRPVGIWKKSDASLEDFASAINRRSCQRGIPERAAGLRSRRDR